MKNLAFVITLLILTSGAVGILVPVLSENSRFAVDSRESGCVVHGSFPQPRQKPWPNSTQDPIIGQ
jgi:hypothetical protein